MSRIVYSSHYNIGFFGLERLHPFDSRKYGRAWKVLGKHFGSSLRRLHVRPKRAASRDELLLVHTEKYLSQLLDPKYVARALELPFVSKVPRWAVDRYILSPMRWATRGTIVAAEEALKHGFAVNLSGGYHHAKPDLGEGFSIYADAAIAVASLRKQKLLEENARVVFVDTDAHQGNGVCHCFIDDKRAFIFDIFNCQIYPSYDLKARNRIDCEVGITCACVDSEYQNALERKLPGFLDSVCNAPVGLAIYNAGTDIFADDPLGLLAISAPAILRRDLYVVNQLRLRNIPTVMVLSGGYTKQSYRLVADSVIGILEQQQAGGQATV